MRTFRAGFLLLALAGCGSVPFFGGGDAAPEKIALADGTVVEGAPGWCVDTATTRAGGDPAVVVLGSCAALNDTGVEPDVQGILTVSVEAQPGAAPSSEELEAFFDTDAGRALLARDGQATSVSILEKKREDDLLFLRCADASTLPGTDDDIWRALFVMEGRFVSISLYGQEEQPIAPDLGLDTITVQVNALRAANQG